jgi:hypothetical protein
MVMRVIYVATAVALSVLLSGCGSSTSEESSASPSSRFGTVAEFCAAHDQMNESTDAEAGAFAGELLSAAPTVEMKDAAQTVDDFWPNDETPHHAVDSGTITEEELEQLRDAWEAVDDYTDENCDS